MNNLFFGEFLQPCFFNEINAYVQQQQQKIWMNCYQKM